MSCTTLESGTPGSCGTSNPSYGVSFNPVPEPSTALLLGFGLIGLARRKGLPTPR